LPAKTITLADLTADTTAVEIFGASYTVRTITRSVQKKLEGLNEALQALEDEEDSDKVVSTLADGLDVLLEGAEGAPAAKALIVKQWKADALSLSQLRGLFEGVQEAAVARPT
jgi:hypothetical protein